MKFTHLVHNLTGETEWYTPSRYVDAAREVMGGITLDPASCPLAQEVVKADDYYTIADDGLLQPWSGNIWINPPYARGVINKFVDRLVAHWEWGMIDAAILLTHNTTDTAWWHTAGSAAKAVCITDHRIRFYNRHGTANSPPRGHTFFYFGPHPRRFFHSFSQFGTVLREAVAGHKKTRPPRRRSGRPRDANCTQEFTK